MLNRLSDRDHAPLQQQYRSLRYRVEMHIQSKLQFDRTSLIVPDKFVPDGLVHGTKDDELFIDCNDDRCIKNGSAHGCE